MRATQPLKPICRSRNSYLPAPFSDAAKKHMSAKLMKFNAATYHMTPVSGWLPMRTFEYHAKRADSHGQYKTTLDTLREWWKLCIRKALGRRFHCKKIHNMPACSDDLKVIAHSPFKINMVGPITLVRYQIDTMVGSEKLKKHTTMSRLNGRCWVMEVT